MFTQCSFDSTKNKLDCYRGKDTKEKSKRYVIYAKKFHADDDNKRYHKLRGHCHYTGKYRGVAHNTCNLRYKISKNSCSIS